MLVAETVLRSGRNRNLQPDEKERGKSPEGKGSFIQGRNRYMTLALKMFQATFSLNFFCIPGGPNKSLADQTQGFDQHIVSAHWVTWSCAYERRGQREGGRESRNSRTGYCSLLPVLSGVNHCGSFFCFVLVSSATATCLSISTSFHKTPTEIPGLKKIPL